MAVIDFGGTKETVVTRKEFSLAKARKVLKKETIAIMVIIKTSQLSCDPFDFTIQPIREKISIVIT